MAKNVKQVIVVRKDLSMRKGKIAAQVGHASMMFLLDNNTSKRADELKVKLTPIEAMWLTGSMAKVVVSVDSEQELKDLMLHAELNGVMCYPVIDAGRTEFHGEPTLTCAAFGPCDENDVNVITGKLKLL